MSSNKELMMGYGYPMELRERVVSAFHRGLGTRQEIADMFDVGIATVGRWLRAEHGTLQTLPHRGGNPRLLTKDDVKILIELVEKRNDSAIEELCTAMLKRTGKTDSHSTLSRELQQAGLTRKKRLLRHGIFKGGTPGRTRLISV